MKSKSPIKKKAIVIKKKPIAPKIVKTTAAQISSRSIEAAVRQQTISKTCSRRRHYRNRSDIHIMSIAIHRSTDVILTRRMILASRFHRIYHRYVARIGICRYRYTYKSKQTMDHKNTIFKYTSTGQIHNCIYSYVTSNTLGIDIAYRPRHIRSI